MNIYRIWQNQNNGYDTFDSAVVVAESEEAARHVHPIWAWRSDDFNKSGKWIRSQDWESSTWARTPDRVSVELIGKADESLKTEQVICASFNAG